MSCSSFFFNDTATTEIYTLSLHDALPIWCGQRAEQLQIQPPLGLERAQQLRRARLRRELLVHGSEGHGQMIPQDRKSTRLNSSHDQISYAVFCLKKKNTSPSPTLQSLITD